MLFYLYFHCIRKVSCIDEYINPLWLIKPFGFILYIFAAPYIFDLEVLNFYVTTIVLAISKSCLMVSRFTPFRFVIPTFHIYAFIRIII